MTPPPRSPRLASRSTPRLAPGAVSGFGPSWLFLLFLLAAVPLLTFLVVAVPAGEVPDEVAHIMRADSVRHGGVAGFRTPGLDRQGDPATEVTVRADRSLLAAGFALGGPGPLAGKRVTQERLDSVLAIPWDNRLGHVFIPNTAVYPPLFYVPAAAGMQLAKVFGAGPYGGILGARTANAVGFVVLAGAALLLARRGRLALFAVFCLPITLALAASVNQDGLVIAAAGLAAALLTRGAPGSWWCGVAVLGAVVMAKPNLAPLAPLVLATVPGGLRRHWGRASGALAVVVLPGLLWGAAMAAFVAAPFVKGPAQPGGPLYAGPPGTLFPTTNPGEQLRILLADPTRLVTLPLDSAWSKGDWFWREIVGILGTLDVVLPIDLYDWWGLALLAVLAAGFVGAAPWRTPGRLAAVVLGLAGALGAAWLVYILQYLSWTLVGEALIEGVQGRYFLPVLAIAVPLMALDGGGRGAAVVRGLLGLPAVGLALANLVAIPVAVLFAYYIR